MNQAVQGASAGFKAGKHFFVSTPVEIDSYEWRCIVRQGGLGRPEKHYEFRPVGGEAWCADSDWVGGHAKVKDLPEVLEQKIDAVLDAQITRAMSGAFVPNGNMTRAAENLLVAMAHEDLVRPVVVAYEEEILAQRQFRIARKYVERGCADTVILDRKQSYMLEASDLATYLKQCFEARDAAGLKVREPDNCPLLEAENTRIKAESLLLEAMAELPNLAAIARPWLTLEARKQAVDLTLNMLAPFCADAKGIINRLVAS
ncbi:hypothetical protein [Paraburkholderia humisilvae]|uniref:Uncharacterized protein n=1 Tax=Paraburkholderia humisilvae TaxID=627669 RepID=A0A6J5DNN9_9BURK|nr:hypothetical protein [Paraburkholderia humisilvae]CAB3754426.1 hypothetical protein LMG29542_02349 [Paraburkholderia humisilvae]